MSNTSLATVLKNTTFLEDNANFPILDFITETLAGDLNAKHKKFLTDLQIHIQAL